jgi:nucleoside-diphosphate-sugar epimerase
MSVPKTFLITGGSGFLANLLHAAGHQVELLDLANYEASDYPESCVFHQGDIRDRALLAEVLEAGHYDIVIHGAAALPLWPRRDIYSINIEGTRNVIELSRHFGVERVVVISSTAVYGVPEKHPLDETDPVDGVGPYGITKIEKERIAAEFRAEGYIVPVIRPKTFVGTGRLGVFQILYDWVQSGVKIPVIGDGHNRYQLLEVEDLVQAIELCSLGPVEKANDVFNVGAKEFATVREDVGALCEHAGNGARVLGTPAGPIKLALQIFEALGLSPLYKWVYGTADKDSFVSTEKIETALGWSPKFSNAQALIRSYDWYLENYKGLAQEGTGVTHRVAWKQGILGLFKKLL